MRLYVKLALLISVFVGVNWHGGKAGRRQAREVSFTARCYFAHLLADQGLNEKLIAEEQERRFALPFARNHALMARQPLPERLARNDMPNSEQ